MSGNPGQRASGKWQETITLKGLMPDERMQVLRTRTMQGAVLVMLGGTMAIGSFGIMFLAVLKGLAFDKFFIAFIAFLMLMSVVIIAWGATRWSSQLVGSVSTDMTKMVTGFAAALLPWKKKDDG